MKKGTNSPIERKISELDKGLPLSKYPLSWMWQQFLSIAGTSRGRESFITPAEWRHCLNIWYRKKIAMGVDKATATNRKSGISKRLADDQVTWACFLDGVQVIMADGRFSDVSMTLTATPADGSAPRTISMSLNSEPPKDVKASRAAKMREMGIGEIVPGQTVRPNQLYIISDDFGNEDLINEVVSFRGKEPRVVGREEFEGYIARGSYLMTVDGANIARDWRVDNVVKDGVLDD